ncbi:MAG: efflux RND transporter periplasmic adaptor subunit [Gammaproteobacteria bacterium]|nr:efflux RND transporter periplasmic adaptor subunit [Gammaproteobacteria bacterium]MBT8110054.1 efflux RND transporter periplasmic adaptor subunit [Gammaproteobacteria bacterium]NNL44758.1 efflux RND transporter periplasmic adaptor subunit [Woeseiaceae bacterium]
MKKKTAWVAAAVIIGAAVAAVIMTNGDEDLLEVQTATVGRETIVQKVNATGRIQPKTQVRISADVSAKIVALHVQEGEWVEQGELLVELDRERYEAAVESAEANVRSAQANAKLVRQNMLKAEKDFERSRDIVERKLESQSVLDASSAAYQVEVARYESVLDQVEQAKASLKQAKDSLSKTIIYSPMSGTISDLDKEQGEIAIGSQFQEDVILIVADLTQMEAQVNVDENDIVNVQLGQHAEIKVDALFGETLTGTVYEIANTANTDAQGTTNQKTEFEVKIAITGETSRLRPGMTASADISTQTRRDVVGVPIQSVAVRTIDQLTLDGEEVADAEKRFTADEDGFVEIVFCVEGDGTVSARQVETGIQSDDMIEILSGIAAGDEVVTGSYRAISTDIRNGAPVAVNNDADARSDKS